MSKQPETRDRIQIIAEAPSLEVVGAALAALTKLGFQNVGYKVITDILEYKQRDQLSEARKALAQSPRISNRQLVDQIIESRKGMFTSAEIMKAFRDAGRRPNSVSPLLYKMTQTGLLEHVGKGQYQRTTKAMNSWALEGNSDA